MPVKQQALENYCRFWYNHRKGRQPDNLESYLFTISVQKTFNASHQLTLPDGSKEPRHSHDWVVTAAVSADKLNKSAVAMDFKQLDAIIDDIICRLAGIALEQLDYFQRNNSSAENLAKYIYDETASLLPSQVTLKCVKVTEEPRYSAEYSE